MIHPRLDGVRFLESFDTKEDSDAPPLPAEVGFQAIELARSGIKVAETFGMSDATIYNWLKQERIDRRGAEMSPKELQELPVSELFESVSLELSTESSTQKRKSSKR